MDQKNKSARVSAFRMPVHVAEKRIKQLAADSGLIDWGNHALERMEERSILDVEVLRVLRGGNVTGSPEMTKNGEWKCKMISRIRGSRDVGVVTIILLNNRLFIKTVEWED